MIIKLLVKFKFLDFPGQFHPSKIMTPEDPRPWSKTPEDCARFPDDLIFLGFSAMGILWQHTQ
jgi:hypothetical protein